jgi:hypothetical protein
MPWLSFGRVLPIMGQFGDRIPLLRPSIVTVTRTRPYLETCQELWAVGYSFRRQSGGPRRICGSPPFSFSSPKFFIP